MYTDAEPLKFDINKQIQVAERGLKVLNRFLSTDFWGQETTQDAGSDISPSIAPPDIHFLPPIELPSDPKSVNHLPLTSFQDPEIPS